MNQRIEVWDLPLRVFHWLLALTVSVALVTGFIGGNAMQWHGRAGILLAALLAFRIAWGFWGSHPARFRSFFPTPRAVTSYLRGEWQGIGHNPLGAFSVFAMLSVLAMQLISGLLGNDDIAFQGPLYNLVSKAESDFSTGLHRKGVWVVLLLVSLHLAAIAFYARIKKLNLVSPMIFGWTDSDLTPPRKLGSRFGLLLALGLGVFAAWAALGSWTPPIASAPPAVSAPSW